MVVVAPGPRDEDLPVEGGRVVRLRGPAMPYDPSYHWLTRVRDARALITRERPDVLQASAPYIAAPVVATLKAPLRVLVVHSDFIEAYARPVLHAAVGPRGAEFALRGPWSLFARGASRFDLTLVAGPWLAEKLRRHGVPRVACVPFGIDHARFSPALRSEELRAELLGPLARDPAARFADAVQVVLAERGGPGVDDQAVLSRRTWRVADLHTKHALLREGLGWGNLPEHLVRDDLRRKRLVVVRPDAWREDEHRLTLYAVHRPDTGMGPAHTWLLERLASDCASALGATRGIK